jgi:hypothetical protein
MARWKLMTNHYLNVEDKTFWEQVEIDRTTGKQRRKQYPVPRFLDINDPGDWTSKLSSDNGEIIVHDGGSHQPTDLRFFGEPTPDMSPLDKEAEAISKRFEKQWRTSADRMISGKTYQDELLEGMHDEMQSLRNQGGQGDMGEAVKMMAEMMKQNQEMLSRLLGPVGQPGRR